MTDTPNNAFSGTYQALVRSRDELIEANNALNTLLEAFRSSSVRLPPLDPDTKRSAQVVRGHSRFGRFARASVEVRSALGNTLISTDELGPAATVDDALDDLEGRLLVALADVRALRAEISP